MSAYWWWDTFAYIGLACVTTSTAIMVWFTVMEFRYRRKANREMREFYAQMSALSRPRSTDV